MYIHVGARPKYSSIYGQSDLPIMLAGLACTGNESNLLDCNKNIYKLLHCHNSQLAGVKCEGTIQEFSYIRSNL